MLQQIKKYLQRIIDDIDAGNSNLEEKELIKAAKMLRELARTDMPMNKYQSCLYLNLKRAQFDNLVRAGEIPRGKKEAGSRELKWFKKDLIKVKKKRESK